MRDMWKMVIAVLIAGLPVQADMLRVQGGSGLWSADPDGSIGYEEGSWLGAKDQLGYDSRYMSYIWADLRHPIPYLPNLRLEYTNVYYEGHTDGVITWWGWNAYLTESAWSEMDIDEYDMILYYNLLDETFWLTLDAGIDIKYAVASYMIRDDYGAGATYNESDGFLIPQGFLRLRAEIPGTDLALEGDVGYIEWSGSYIYNARLKIDYLLKLSGWPGGAIGIEAGYRQQRIWINEEEYSTKIDIDASGFYMGGIVRF